MYDDVAVGFKKSASRLFRIVSSIITTSGNNLEIYCTKSAENIFFILGVNKKNSVV
jgi:hypothetical protein